MEPKERPRGNVPWSLYLSYFKAGGNCVTLLAFLIFALSAQVKRNVTSNFPFVEI